MAQPARPERAAEYRSGSGAAWLDGLVRRSMEREWSGGTERRVVTVEQYGGAAGGSGCCEIGFHAVQGLCMATQPAGLHH